MTKLTRSQTEERSDQCSSREWRLPLNNRTGFTLIELMIVSAIIAILISLLLPALQQAREAARRAQCKSNLKLLALAMHTYYDQFDMFPAGTINADGPIRNETAGYHHNWVIALLPHLEQGPLSSSINTDVSIYDLANREVRRTRLSVLLCPSDPAREKASVTGERLEPLLTNFAGSHHSVETPIDTDNNGVLFLNSFIRTHAIEDGTTHTIAIGEFKRAMDDLGWASGTRATLRNCGRSTNNTPGGMAYYGPPLSGETPGNSNGQEWIDQARTSFIREQQSLRPDQRNQLVGGFGSHHTGGMHAALADGSIRYISENINPIVYERLGHRADHELIVNF